MGTKPLSERDGYLYTRVLGFWSSIRITANHS